MSQKIISGICPQNIYGIYPEDLNDNIHFQPEGATEVSRLVFEEMKNIDKK